MTHVYNFSAGPAILPRAVLEEAQKDLVDYQGTGMSIMEMSHRGGAYEAVHDEALANLRELLEAPDEYAILFLQGGASHQFAMAPMNLLPSGKAADYTLSGAWAKKAVDEARKVGKINIVADTDKARPTRVPAPEELRLDATAAYVHITSNETISGAQWPVFPKIDAPLVADMSSDILSRRFDVSQFGLIYAGAQKNLGPSGVTIVVIRKDLAEKGAKDLPAILQYRTAIENNSLYNTPPTFAIYLAMLVTRWMRNEGGVAAIEKRNQLKAGRLYEAIDATDFYRGAADPKYRSLMNVTFNLPTPELEAQFAKQAEKEGLSGLKGHRSVGGLRASIYNAFPEKGVEALVAFMREFERKNG
ncbi:MAG: 3-phosphoserine/phosphohydroxythreonine transaminase [Candidatus Hydrogenedentales bacterium]